MNCARWRGMSSNGITKIIRVCHRGVSVHHTPRFYFIPFVEMVLLPVYPARRVPPLNGRAVGKRGLTLVTAHAKLRNYDIR